MHIHDDDVEIMISAFDQQNGRAIIEMNVEVDTVSYSNIPLPGGAVSSRMSSGPNLSCNDWQTLTIMQRVVFSDDDDNYIMSNSFTKETSKEEDEIDGDFFDTNDKAMSIETS